VRIIAPEGSIVNARPPAPSGLCTLHCAQEIIEAVWKALSQAVPEKVPAGWGRLTTVGATVGLDPRTDEPYTCFHFNSGAGAGAIWGFDGWHALSSPIACGGAVHYDIETLEAVYPHFVLQYELHEDSAGPGKWRGGCGIAYSFRNYGQDTLFSSFSEGLKTETFGILGGRPSSRRPQVKIIRGKEEICIDSKQIIELGQGDVVMGLNQGGAGVGNPFEREVERVREDILNGIVSLEMAEHDYGVVVDPDSLEVNAEATETVRKQSAARS